MMVRGLTPRGTAPRAALSLLTAVALAAALGAGAPPAAAMTTPTGGAAGPAASAPAAPATILLDGARLARIRQQLTHGGNTELTADLGRLVRTADAALQAGPWSVLDKKQTAASGDRHDYLSYAPYWWPSRPKTPDNPLGCPYVQRDGDRNPAVDEISDHAERDAAWIAVHDLALAWYFTGDARYAQRAALDLRTWFLAPATRMNPSMRFAQLIPCVTEVRGTGIIEASESLPQMIDALVLLDAGAPGWTGADQAGMRAWLSQFQTWLRTSTEGKLETAAENNHGSFKDLLDSTLALYLGQPSLAQTLVSGARRTRIANQIEPTGKQPLELARTRSWHYSVFNVLALCRLAAAGRRVGVDLWAYTSPRGGSMAKAVDFLIPAAEHGRKKWPYQQIDAFDQSIARPGLHAAAEEAADAKARAAIGHVPAPAGGDLWALLPAC